MILVLQQNGTSKMWNGHQVGYFGYLNDMVSGSYGGLFWEAETSILRDDCLKKNSDPYRKDRA